MNLKSCDKKNNRIVIVIRTTTEAINKKRNSMKLGEFYSIMPQVNE